MRKQILVSKRKQEELRVSEAWFFFCDKGSLHVSLYSFFLIFKLWQDISVAFPKWTRIVKVLSKWNWHNNGRPWESANSESNRWLNPLEGVDHWKGVNFWSASKTWRPCKTALDGGRNVNLSWIMNSTRRELWIYVNDNQSRWWPIPIALPLGDSPDFGGSPSAEVVWVFLREWAEEAVSVSICYHVPFVDIEQKRRVGVVNWRWHSALLLKTAISSCK